MTRQVAHDELMNTAVEIAESILLGAPDARFQVKRILNAGYGLVDYMTFFDSLGSDECREGMTAFAENRSPNWIPEKLRTGERL